MWKRFTTDGEGGASSRAIATVPATGSSSGGGGSHSTPSQSFGSNSSHADTSAPPPPPPPPSSEKSWYSSIMSSPNVWVLLGLGIAGIIIFARSRRKQISKDFGAFIKTLELLPPPQPAPPSAPHPLSNLTFAAKDIFDIEGFVTGFGNPDWERTHEPASRTATAVSLLVQAGATCVGKTHMDEMAYSIWGQNKHYGTPVNPAASSRLPGGSSSGSAVAVAACLVDFALGTDTGASVRIPAAFCGIMGFRPSHGAVSCIGVVPMSQSLDTVGWFARDPDVLRTVGHVLLQQPYAETRQPKRVLIADDCFRLSLNAEDTLMPIVINSVESTYGRQVVTRIKLGQYISSKIPSLKRFKADVDSEKAERGVSSLNSLRNALQLLQRYEFKTNHEEWVNSVKPSLGPGTSDRVNAAIQTSSELVADAFKVRNEARVALNELLTNDGILVIPTSPGPPPKLRLKESHLVDYWEKAYTLLSIAGMSGSCQVSMPVGQDDGYPMSVSLIAKHGADRFLLDTAKSLFPVLQKGAEAYTNGTDMSAMIARKPDAAESAKEKGNAAFKKKDYRTAVEYYSEAIRQDETNATYYSNRAAAYLALSSFLLAEADCSKALELDKKNVKAYLRRGTAREFLGYHKEADEDFKQALVLEPTNKAAADGIERVRKFIYR